MTIALLLNVIEIFSVRDDPFVVLKVKYIVTLILFS